MNNRIWKWIFRLMAIGVALFGVAAIALQLALPTIVRAQVRSILDQVGLRDAKFEVTSASIYGVQISNLRAGEQGELEVSSARIDYAPLKAIGGRIESLRIDRANFVIDLNRGSALSSDDEGATSKPGDFFRSVDTKGLPLWRIELADCSLTLVRGEQKFVVRADGWMWRERADRARLSLQFRIANAPAYLDGSVDFSQRRLDLSAGASEVDLTAVLPFTPVNVRAVVASASGFAKIVTSLTYVANRLHPTLAVELRDGNVITSSDYGIEVRGARGNVALQNLNPLRAQPGQTIYVDQLKLTNDVTLEQLHVEFGIERKEAGRREKGAQVSLPASLLLSVFKFNWAGGEISSAGPVVLNPRELSGAISLQLRHVGLNEFLKLVSSGKASGVGALSGDLPIQTKWPYISIGTGQIRSDAPGDINFGPQVNDLANTVAERDPRLKGQKEQLVAALTNFRYDQIVFDFQRTEQGLSVTSRITGRGTQGTNTPIDLTIRYNGLEEALNTYLGTTLRVRSSSD